MKPRIIVPVALAGLLAISVLATVWAIQPFPAGEDFDVVTAPALPTGWVASQGTNAASSPAWVTSATLPDAGTNDVYSVNSTDILDNYLDTPSFTGSSANSNITFRGRYDLESGFDGAVLEISITGVNGGAFQDIITAGGSWVAGGYNGTIGSNFSSPIAGRSAWTGNSSGYVSTSVDLPSSAIGQSVKLRWRLASDNSYGTSGGWRIDSINLCGTDPLNCLMAEVSGSAAFTSYKNSMVSQLNSAKNYFALGTPQGKAQGCSVLLNWKTTVTGYAYSPPATGVTTVMATAWNAKVDLIRTSKSC